MFIRSERLFLRPGWPEDWQDLHEGINDEGVVRNLAAVPWPYTAEAARDFAGLAQDRRHPHFLITLPGAHGTRLIGCVGLAPAAEGSLAPVELGYWIAREWWGRGFATEAGRAVLGLARTLGHGAVCAGPFIDNPASARVLAKLGFQPVRRSERFSRARGYAVSAQDWLRELGASCDCDGAAADADAMRAA